MQKRTKKHNIKRKILSALITSAISAATLNPLAFALPVQEEDMTAGVNIATSANNLQMDISGAADNNVINWSKFNIAQNETVAFDAKNYLNLINDREMSKIWGTLKGGGSIYLINPNGILFGKGAIVDVGTLYASTREISEDLQTQFESDGTIPPLTKRIHVRRYYQYGDA
ncbi:MAG: filamentous hemagglutinin N-terminal domain-containing protein [Selenomonadaceae bacterium]|nr:filamentous hemagglutinin N-terminal domain-containing protein [Selenomonadaceae bacterium]